MLLPDLSQLILTKSLFHQPAGVPGESHARRAGAMGALGGLEWNGVPRLTWPAAGCVSELPDDA
jgi:hypothetical protein